MFWIFLITGLCLINLNALYKIKNGLSEEFAVSTLDLICLLLRGEPGLPILPFQWLSISCGLLFVPCSYSCSDLTDDAYKTLVYSKSRRAWWISKTVLIHGIPFILFSFFIVIAAIATWRPDGYRFGLLARFEELGIFRPLAQASLCTQAVWLLLLPCMAFCTVASIQNALAILLGPTAAYFVSILFLSISVGTRTGFLFPAVTMTSRAAALYEAGVSPILVLCLMLFSDLAINGVAYGFFRKLDLMHAPYLEVNQ